MNRQEFLSDKVCAHCGTTDNLHLHHVDPSTKRDGYIWHWSEDRRNAEIAKCIVLCSACHRKHHGKEQRERNAEFRAEGKIPINHSDIVYLALQLWLPLAEAALDKKKKEK